jgi:hypothetical protein
MIVEFWAGKDGIESCMSNLSPYIALSTLIFIYIPFEELLYAI